MNNLSRLRLFNMSRSFIFNNYFTVKLLIILPDPCIFYPVEKNGLE